MDIHNKTTLFLLVLHTIYIKYRHYFVYYLVKYWSCRNKINIILIFVIEKSFFHPPTNPTTQPQLGRAFNGCLYNDHLLTVASEANRKCVCGVGWAKLIRKSWQANLKKKTRLSLWFMSNIAKTVGVGGGSDAYMYVLFLIFITDIYSQPHWFIPKILLFPRYRFLTNTKKSYHNK